MEELVREAINGDKEAFSKIILSLQVDLYKVARLRLYSIDDINDAVQETIIKAYKNIKKLKKPKFFKTWIIKILINECNTIYRQKIRSGETELNEEITPKEFNNTITEIDTRINELDFNMIIDLLSYEDKMLFLLFYLEEFSCREIASIMGLKENTVKVKLKRAREKLKKMLGENRYE